jgi:hypothetical protein
MTDRPERTSGNNGVAVQFQGVRSVDRAASSP